MVGVREDQNPPYYIIKNSWGTGWGEGGFMRLALGNTCGVLQGASYPNMF